MALERDDLIDGLREIVAELRANGEHVGIRIVGGAALSLRYFDRASTVDIDAAIHHILPMPSFASRAKLPSGEGGRITG